MLNVHVTLSGAFFAQLPSAQVQRGLSTGLEIAGLLGQRYVQEQLYPGHGVRTGHFRRSIWGGQVSARAAQIDAGLQQQGANVIYTNWLETGTRRGQQTAFPGYHMFENAHRRLSSAEALNQIKRAVAARL